MKLTERFKRSWDAFRSNDQNREYYDHIALEAASYTRPDRYSSRGGIARSFVNYVFNRISVDIMMLDFKHVKINDEGRFQSVVKDAFNDAMTLSANIDQTGRDMIKDTVMSLLDEGSVAVVPVITDIDPNDTESFVVEELRVGKIVTWYPKKVRVDLYNEKTGLHEEIEISKSACAILENPFYTIMNGQDSTLQRLIRVLNQLDAYNEDNTSGKMGLIIQLPFPARIEARQKEAEERRTALENQMKNSKYGIGYIGAEEKIIQLNKPVDNNLWEQAKDLSTELFNKLGISQAIFDGTATEEQQLTYFNSTIDPIATLIVEEFKRKFLSRTAITQGHSVMYFRDPFRVTPVNNLAEIVDKMTRNEVMTSNEVRSIMGMMPKDDALANKLWNSNINHPDEMDVKNSDEEQEENYTEEESQEDEQESKDHT